MLGRGGRDPGRLPVGALEAHPARKRAVASHSACEFDKESIGYLWGFQSFVEEVQHAFEGLLAGVVLVVD